MTTLISRNIEMIRELCRKFEVETLEVFGSATRPDFDPTRSDVDFVVVFKPAPPTLHAQRYFGLLAALQDLLSSPVDLVEGRALNNPYLLQSINNSRESLYAA